MAASLGRNQPIGRRNRDGEEEVGAVSAVISETPHAAEARTKLKQRDDAIRANAIKQGRQAERAEILAKLGALALEDVRLTAELKAQHAAEVERMTQAYRREERKYGKGQWWQGAVFGGAIIGSAVAVGASLYTRAVIGNVFDAAAQMRAQSDITEAVERSLREPENH
jgi:broad specificity phosphatase PhoE